MELFKILGTIAVTNSDANEAIDETTGKAEDSAGRVSGAFEMIGNAALALGKIVATGLAVATTAIVALTAQSVQAYANYEQLVGGVETIFKDAQDTVMGYAEEAYKTAGMSANQYLETVTSFSASLIQSLEGDTQAAAEKANQAILDMSDNANKMGTDISSLQYAYQGFAKMNYTMLDNLKIGYGGTKEEMQRLLADAEKLSGVKYDISSYADIVDAIHVVQTEMGITGTTAEEASGTISGSAASMKAAWDNLVIGLGDDNADLTALIDTFIDSLLASADNMLPRIEKILGGIGVLIEELVPKIAEKLPGMLQTLLPGLLTGAVSLFTGIVSALPGLLQILLEQMPFIISEISLALQEALPLLLDGAEQIFGQLFSFIFNDLLGTDIDAGELFSSINQAILTVGDTFMSLVPVMQSFATELIPQLMPLIEKLLPIVADLLVIIAPLIADLVPQVTVLVSSLISNLMPTLLSLCDFISLYVIPAIEMIAEWLGPVLSDTIASVSLLLEGLAQTFSGIMEFIVATVQFWLAIFQGDWNGAWESMKNAWKALWDIIVGLLKSAFSGIITLVTKNWDKISSFFSNAWTWCVNGFNKAKDFVVEIFGKIKDAITEKIESAVQFVRNGIDKLKSFFNFQWSLPKLKMPHFNISGSFSLNPPSVPSFGVDWYAKGAVLNEPTAFGMNGNKLMVGGEAGPEAIAPIATLQKYVEDAVARQNAALVESVNDGFSTLMAFLNQYIPEMSNMQLVMDSGAVVGQLAPGMDAALGKLAMRNGRGV